MPESADDAGCRHDERGGVRGGLAVPLCTALLATLALAAGAAVAAEPLCGDFLAAAGRKPPRAEFAGCAPGQSAQLRTLVATYRVRGSDATRVERYLVRHTGMPRLRFACCGWEPGLRAGRRTGVVGQGADALEVSMSSGETLLNRRAQWPRVTSFQVTATRWLDQP